MEAPSLLPSLKVAHAFGLSIWKKTSSSLGFISDVPCPRDNVTCISLVHLETVRIKSTRNIHTLLNHSRINLFLVVSSNGEHPKRAAIEVKAEQASFAERLRKSKAARKALFQLGTKAWSVGGRAQMHREQGQPPTTAFLPCSGEAEVRGPPSL